jgi:hypothetical protein
VLWAVLDRVGAWTRRINGVWLPSLRRFTATVPAKISAGTAIGALDTFRVYVVDQHEVPWAATL